MIENLKCGDVLLTKKIGRPLIDDIIWFCSKVGRNTENIPMVSHIAIYLGDEEIFEAWQCGLRRSKDEFRELFKKYNVYALRPKKEINIDKFKEDCFSYCGKQFAWGKAIKVLFKQLLHHYGINIHLKDKECEKYTCNEVATKIYRNQGIDPKSKYCNLEVNPLDYYLSNEFYEIGRHIIE